MYEIFEKLLKEKGVKVANVTRATGIASSTFTDWKKGRYIPKDDKMQKIAEYFGVSVEYLRTGETSQKETYYLDPEVAEMAQEMATRTELKVLFKASRNMTKEQLEAINNMINAMND